MTVPSVLIAGIGNIFLGDDAFGVEVAQRLTQCSWPAGVRVEDFGIRGFDLAYAILDGYDVTILVDATPRGGDPGTLYLIEPDQNMAGGAGIEPHGMDPVKVLQLVKTLSGAPPEGLTSARRILLVGCEPETFGPEDEGQMGLSAPVEAALDDAVLMVERLVQQIHAEAAVVADNLSQMEGDNGAVNEKR
jgi:hydrogenase maturation protease